MVVVRVSLPRSRCVVPKRRRAFGPKEDWPNWGDGLVRVCAESMRTLCKVGSSWSSVATRENLSSAGRRIVCL